MLYRCFWCDRVTKYANVMVLDRATGYLKCDDCARYDEGVV